LVSEYATVDAETKITDEGAYVRHGKRRYGTGGVSMIALEVSGWEIGVHGIMWWWWDSVVWRGVV
jgi:hypothetical protein